MCLKYYQLLKFFNNTIESLSGVFYLTTHLFLNESIYIIGTFEECVVKESELIPCIEVMKFKWLEYYKTIPNIYLLVLVLIHIVK